MNEKHIYLLNIKNWIGVSADYIDKIFGEEKWVMVDDLNQPVIKIIL